MEFALGAVVILLCLFCLYLIIERRNRNRNLRYIQDKLKAILSEDSKENVQVFDADKLLQPFLVEINMLLEAKRKSAADYIGAQMSMKKMLSNISHDLKTPLTVLSGYVETLKLNPQMDADGREAIIHKLQDKTAEMVQLIHKFFDFARLDANDKDIPLTAIHMNEVLQRNTLAFYDLVHSKGFEVHFAIPEQKLFAWANDDALDRIFQNLISNAIKYGDEGKCVGVSLWQEEEWVYAEVWDRGKGIGQAHQDHVFDRLYTLDDSRSADNKGSGLGLAITKKLVEAMNGEIFLSSRPFERTSFTFRLKGFQIN